MVAASTALALILQAAAYYGSSHADDSVVVIAGVTHQDAQTATTPSKPKKRPKPSIRVTCTPSNAWSGARTPAVITVRLVIEYPDERLWCPKVEWYAGDDDELAFEFMGSHEADCEPYQSTPEGESGPKRWSEDIERTIGLGPGDYKIEAKLIKAGKFLASGSCRVTVR